MAAARNSPGDDGVFRTEIYVDASQWGVGFVMDKSWLAWKFSDLLANAPIDTKEMLAVEVGLWTVIHWVSLMKKEGECSNSVEVLVRCDNTGVVKAIEKRRSNVQPLQEILLRIIDMIDGHDIELAVKWVPSINNPADSPSRGVPSPGKVLLPFIPLLPTYLSDTLSPNRSQGPKTARRRKGPRCHHRTTLEIEYRRPDPLEGFHDADNYVDSYDEDNDWTW